MRQGTPRKHSTKTTGTTTLYTFSFFSLKRSDIHSAKPITPRPIHMAKKLNEPTKA